MNQEDKQLLLADLSARLRYGLIVSPSDCGNARLVGCLLDSVLIQDIRTGECYNKPWDIEYVMPYLRPMSSMTEEEENEWCGLNIDPLLEAVNERHTRIEDLMLRAKSQYKPLDWLNKKMFDYRGLIEKGLAIAVTEENNPYKG